VDFILNKSIGEASSMSWYRKPGIVLALVMTVSFARDSS
jgi:hypothetical protein